MRREIHMATKTRKDVPNHGARIFASPVSVADDFRKVTPLVLMDALKRGGTQVYEPFDEYDLEVPADRLNVVMARLAEAGAAPEEQRPSGAAWWTLTGTLPTRHVYEFESRLPGLTRGEGAFSSRLRGYLPVRGPVPSRPRTDGNPLNRKEYMLHALRRV